MEIDEATLTRVALAHSIPPSVLSAVAARDNGSGTMGASQGSLSARGISANDVKGDPNLAIEMAATQLQQSFQKYGDWEQALSYYSTGDEKAYQNPNNSAGGFVYSVLGGAATQPDYGLQDVPQGQLTIMLPGLQSLSTHMQGLAEMGGVVTPQSVQGFQGFIKGIQSNGPGPGAFPGDPFPYGQCTWLAKGLRPDAQVNGDAGQWVPNSQKAEPGALVIYNGGHGYSQEGHVGVVTQVNPDGTFQVLSDNWGGVGEINLGMSSMADVKGFYAPTSPQQGQQVAQSALQIAGDPQAQQQVITQAQVALTGAPKPIQEAPKSTQDPAKSTQTPQQLGGPATAPHKDTHNPAEVAQFAQQLKALNIDPQRLIQNFGSVASMFRYHGAQVPDLHTYAGIANLDPSQQKDYVRAQPHPTQPNLNLGQVKDAFQAAMLHAITYMNRTPYDSEAQRFAASGANWQQMSQYYQTLQQQAQQHSQATVNPPSNPALQQSESGKQKQLEKQQ
jgi:CHAP domain